MDRLSFSSSCDLLEENHDHLKFLNRKSERKVLVIYTGGTIGMSVDKHGCLSPVPVEFEQKVRSLSMLHDTEYQSAEHFKDTENSEYLVLPDCLENYRILYKINEYAPLLDSSNMTMDDWIRIAIDIQESYELYDGFVVLHGTDTLAYTASALSFMLENLGKSVVLTGSQIPLFAVRSDAKENFLGALIFASDTAIPEVTIYFQHKLFRGNRTTKVSSESFDAFNSPNSQPLATVSINIDVDYKNIFRSKSIQKLRVQTELSQNVGVLRIFPNITASTIRKFLQPPIKGVVLQSYGSGNIPSNREDILAALQEATARNIFIINCTQCMKGSVRMIYETGRSINLMGVISGMDMTPECALTKLSYVLSKNEWDYNAKRTMMMKNIRGELTSSNTIMEVTRSDFISTMISALHLTSKEDINQVNNVVCASMLMDAVINQNLEKVKYLQNLGYDLLCVNQDKRSALHFACIYGNYSIAHFLLNEGCSVHARDNFEHSPLNYAVMNDHHNIIKLLVTSGAHLINDALIIGQELCTAVACGNLKRLESYQLAGADFNQVDFSGRTALHMASLHNNMDCLLYLLRNGVKSSIKDLCNMTARNIAEQMKHNEVLLELKAYDEMHSCKSDS